MDTITTPAPAGITDQATPDGPVRCPLCAQINEPGRLCRHVRWTFDQGDPIEFAQFTLETSPYVRARGHKASEITRPWWAMNGEFVVDLVLLHFHAEGGYVFGELAHLDLLARDIWREFRPEIERPMMHRVDPV